MDYSERDYPPNPTGMDEEAYKAGVDVLFKLLKHEHDTEVMTHVEKVLTSIGVDSALYLLYYGHLIKEQIDGVTWDARKHQAAFKVLLQTACSIGALVSKTDTEVIDKLDKLWDIPYPFEWPEDES